MGGGAPQRKGRRVSVGLALLGWGRWVGVMMLISQLVIVLGKDHSLYQEGLSDKESDSQEVREQATEMDL